MDPTVWLDRLTEAVKSLIRDVDVARVDDMSCAYAHGDTVCTVHVFNRSTAGVVISTRGDGHSPETRVEHGEPHHEAVDEFSLLTLPRAIAAALSRS